MTKRLAPEIDVADLGRPLAFCTGVVGFRMLFERPEQRFGMVPGLV
jgi:hypothetical protein